MIQTCGEILPSEKTKLVKTIRSYKHPGDENYMDEDEKAKKKAAEQKEASKSQTDVEKELILAKAGFELNQTSFSNWIDVINV